MSDYSFPAPLAARLAQIQQMPVEQIMASAVSPRLALVFSTLINEESISNEELAIACMVTLSTVMAISIGRGLDYGQQSPLEQASGMTFTPEDLLQFHLAFIRHCTEHIIVAVRSEHMDMKTGVTTPERAM